MRNAHANKLGGRWWSGIRRGGDAAAHARPALALLAVLAAAEVTIPALRIVTGLAVPRAGTTWAPLKPQEGSQEVRTHR